MVKAALYGAKEGGLQASKLTVLGKMKLGVTPMVRFALETTGSFDPWKALLLKDREVISYQVGKGYVHETSAGVKGTLRVALMTAAPLEADHKAYVGTTHPHWERQFVRS